MSSILFCTPCYGGMLTAQHFQSCMNLKETLVQVGLKHDWLVGWNESLIHRARNEMAGAFLKTDHSHLMFLDADIQFEPEGVASLWNLDADIAVGFYAMKKVGNPIAAWRGGKLVDLKDCPREPFEVDLAGTGFMLIKREVLERVAADLGSYQGPYGRVPAIFQAPVHDDELESEDYFFCRRARQAGFKILGDPIVKLGHVGQFVYGA